MHEVGDTGNNQGPRPPHRAIELGATIGGGEAGPESLRPARVGQRGQASGELALPKVLCSDATADEAD